ncbi:hypothetical protein K788_0008236 [Paraburkholderia caribensis MBA4]|uniref:Uncharacterized protein n=1 Tax=Paraburkholderia caribensis MBA4 TaxID=1323664 RepID=A0A0P0RFN1_9BURK|nr:hypothetical protein K788_0008236 [Paraburkholderia caribensis MBA4]
MIDCSHRCQTYEISGVARKATESEHSCCCVNDAFLPPCAAH